MRGTVLIVDDDQHVSRLVAEVLQDEGFAVSWLAVSELSAIQHEVARLEPDAVLLDGGDSGGYGRSWRSAVWLHTRQLAIPVVMFTAHAVDLAEAKLGQTERSQQAAFVGFVAKPFDLGTLIDTVDRATRRSTAASLVTTGPSQL